jgi:C1A family cysteine protease
MLVGLTIVPVAVGVDSSTDEFMFYKSGVFNFKGCGTDIDHAMLAVGYQLPQPESNDSGYWIVRNSFGPTWGESGYIRFAMTPNGDPGICGV